jgi:hypothetical protein
LTGVRLRRFTGGRCQQFAHGRSFTFTWFGTLVIERT